MIKISCSNYGFDCKFEVDVNDLTAIEKYQKHSIDEHGIEYSVEAITQVTLRMKH